MPDWARWLIAVLIVLVLLAVFFVTFVLYRRTPAPKGCEDLHPSEELCKGCRVASSCAENWYKTEAKKEVNLPNAKDGKSLEEENKHE
jgi:hypothetical protein